MNLVDSSCWLEFFGDGPNAAEFRKPIEDTENLIVPTIVLLEVFKRAFQLHGEQAAKEAIVQMSQGHVVDLDRALALASARIGLELKLSLADGVILATARAHGATLWTQDAHFRGIDHVKYVPAKSLGR